VTLFVSATLRRYWQAFFAFVRISLAEETAYRGHFAISLLQSFFWLGWFLAMVRVYFLHTDRLGGWRYEEVLAVVGVFQIVNGVIQTVFQPNIGRLVEYVRLGTLDFWLTKPLDSQFTVSTRYFVLWRSVSALAGFGLVGYAAWRLGISLTPMRVLLFLLLLTCALCIVYSIMLGVMTLCFWFVRLENLIALLWSFWETGRYPVTVYRGIPRFLLTYIVPVAFVTTVPAQAIVRWVEPLTAALAVALAAGMLAATRVLWQFALRHYSGASS
jgi:ABC-2 type transport system permease protein